jgi:PAS domain S-box-containing protein
VNQSGPFRTSTHPTAVSSFEAIGTSPADLSRLLAETIEATVVVFGPDDVVTYASSEFERLFGRPTTEILGQDFTVMMTEHERTLARRFVTAIAAGDMFPIVTWLLRREVGEPVWVESRVTVVRDHLGAPTSFITVTRDMTERRLATAALYRTRADYDALVRRAAFGVFRAEADSRILDANPALVEMLGYVSRSDLLSLDLGRDIHADRAEYDWVLRMAELGTLDDWVEVTWRKRNGETIDVRLSLRVVDDDAGGPLVFEGIAEDITQRRRHDERLRRSERMASLGHMLAGVAHELNNPLAAIGGFSQLLLKQPQSDDDRKALETIWREARRAERIVRDLLVFSRHGEQQTSETVDLHGVIRHIVGTQRYALESRGVAVHLWLASARVEVHGETSRIEQVLMNLVVNARQALETMRTETGTAAQQPLELRISTRVDGEAVLLTVSDTAGGIPPGILDRIWDPFFTTKDEGTGTGLGLSLVHTIVQEHGGTIDVRSVLGQGTEFVIRLPLVQEPKAAAAAPTPQNSAAIEMAARALDVLVVDDESAILSLLTRFLGGRGHAVVTASDGLHALRIAEQFHFDVVVCDLHMPGLDGVELIRRMRQLPAASGTRYILSTGDDRSAPGMVAARTMGVDGILAKPYAIDELQALVEQGDRIS